jgi:hypothetical protein
MSAARFTMTAGRTSMRYTHATTASVLASVFAGSLLVSPITGIARNLPGSETASASQAAPSKPGAPATEPRHVVVFQETGRYGGWPANHGAWIWGNEILVGFDDGVFNLQQKGHTLTRTISPKQRLGRSLDGGETWTIEEPTDLRLPSDVGYQDDYPAGEGRPLSDSPGGFDFTHPDSAFTARMTHNPGVSRFYYSEDRGHTWAGPYKLPNFGRIGTAARTDYVVNGKHDLSLFITLAKANGKEGRPAMVRTRDGGKTWNLVSLIGDEPPETDYAIMPATAQLAKRTLLTAIRHRGYVQLYRSTDGGESWRIDGERLGTGRGNPASLIRLKDGRLVLTYGFRAAPFGIRARVSADDGKTWQEEVVLRSDGGNDDLGYPRSVQRPDGKVVTIYYYNVDKAKERFIAATIWQP